MTLIIEKDQDALLLEKKRPRLIVLSQDQNRLNKYQKDKDNK